MGSERAEAKKDVSPLKKAFQPSPSSCTGCLCHYKPCRGKGLLQATVLFNLPGCQLCFNHQLHLWRILLEHNLDLRSNLPGPLSQLCWSVSQTNQSSCSCCSETSGEGFLQAAVLLHLPGFSFASTTSCTFGGFFWRTTLTCAQIFPVLSANSSGRSLQPNEEPQERGFFRFACYGTCSAASFASTTSCTFGGLFWRTTLTCAQIFPVLAANQG